MLYLGGRGAKDRTRQDGGSRVNGLPSAPGAGRRGMADEHGSSFYGRKNDEV